jgi:ribonuclease III
MTNSSPIILPERLPKLPKLPRENVKEASTHPSATSTDNPNSYNRLGCLGNAALNYAVTHILYSEPLISSAGDITEIRKRFVENGTLAQWAIAYKLKVNVAAHSEVSPEMSAKCFLAHIGAISTFSTEDLFRIVEGLMRPTLNVIIKERSEKGITNSVPVDSLRQLNEIFSKAGMVRDKDFKWEEEDEGIKVDPRFEVKCRIKDKIVGKGSGNRKQIAYQRAAEQALKNKGSTWQV